MLLDSAVQFTGDHYLHRKFLADIVGALLKSGFDCRTGHSCGFSQNLHTSIFI